MTVGEVVSVGVGFGVSVATTTRKRGVHVEVTVGGAATKVGSFSKANKIKRALYQIKTASATPRPSRMSVGQRGGSERARGSRPQFGQTITSARIFRPQWRQRIRARCGISDSDMSSEECSEKQTGGLPRQKCRACSQFSSGMCWVTDRIKISPITNSRHQRK